MTGTIALCGGGPFTANDELDRRLVAGTDRVVVLPTADAFEHPERLVAGARAWGERLGVEVEALMVLRRAQATETSAANAVQHAQAVWFVGDSPLHLRSVVKDTPLWDAVRDLLANGGTVVGVGGSAAALCDPMTDPRGGAFTLGLGLVSGLAIVTESETWSDERLHRTCQLADTPLAVLPTGSALLRTPAGWERVGAVEVIGELPE
jgi:cyanophycinase